jgi:hypothetical protein
MNCCSDKELLRYERNRAAVCPIRIQEPGATVDGLSSPQLHFEIHDSDSVLHEDPRNREAL